jgi:hypothetical protein
VTLGPPFGDELIESLLDHASSDADLGGKAATAGEPIAGAKRPLLQQYTHLARDLQRQRLPCVAIEGNGEGGDGRSACTHRHRWSRR